MGKRGTAEAQVHTALGRKLFSARSKMSRQVYMRWRTGRSFTFQGRTYTYCQQPYNYSWRNERAVEIPIFQDVVRRYEPSQVLEVGNVLYWYGPRTHEVVDKYEQMPDIRNVDIVDYAPGRTYDLIVAISTLEHVGWDEDPRDPPKIRRAINHLRQLLAPNGTLMVSVPIGYNSELDALLAARDVPWQTCTYLKRAHWDNIWREVGWRDIAHARYDNWTPTATALAIATVGPELG